MNAKILLKISLLVLTLTVFLMGTMDADAARRRRGNAGAEQAQALFPDATRAEPKVNPSGRLQRDLNKLIEANSEDQYEEVVTLGSKLVEAKSAGAYERALAWQLIGIAKQQMDDDMGAITAFQNALAADGLDNNAHYGTMQQIANLQYQNEQYQQAVATIDRFLAETHKEDAQMLALKGGTLYQMEHYDEAAEAIKRAIAASDKPSDNWYQLLMGSYMGADRMDDAAALGETMLAKNPDDSRLIFNLATLYAQAGQEAKATEVLESARARNMLDERGYRQLYALYSNMDGKEQKVVEVVKDGLDRGILQPSTEVYTILGQSYYFSNQPDAAIAAYKQGLQYAQDGEAALNLARILSAEQHYADSRTYARQAIDKGVRRPGEAWVVIGRAEFGLGNKAGLVSAYREAAKFPETREVAEEWLRKNASR